MSSLASKSMQIASLLTNELELGQKLNHSVETGDQANFALLLSMLSKDVCQQSQFSFDTQVYPDDSSPSLREQFELPRAQQLVAQDSDELQSLALAKLAQEQGLLAMRLSHCVNPEALCFGLDKTHDIDTQVFDNLDMHTAARFAKQKAPKQVSDIDITQLLNAQQDYGAQLHVA